MWPHFALLRKNPNQARGCGLTLVELLLAVTLFSSLFAAVGGLLRSAVNVQSQWGQAAAPVRQLDLGLRRLERDLESRLPLFTVQDRGEPTWLELARVEDVAQPDGSVEAQWVRVVYRIVSEGETSRLLRETFPCHDTEPDAEPLSQETVLTLVEGAFSYGARDAQQQLVWLEAWDGPAHGAPRLVKLELALPAAGVAVPLRLERVFRTPSGALPMLETP